MTVTIPSSNTSWSLFPRPILHGHYTLGQSINYTCNLRTEEPGYQERLFIWSDKSVIWLLWNRMLLWKEILNFSQLTKSNRRLCKARVSLGRTVPETDFKHELILFFIIATVIYWGNNSTYEVLNLFLTWAYWSGMHSHWHTSHVTSCHHHRIYSIIEASFWQITRIKNIAPINLCWNVFEAIMNANIWIF